jgi:hypothetical protein
VTKPGTGVFIAEREINCAVTAFSAPLHLTGLRMSRAFTIAHGIAGNALLSGYTPF